MTEMIYPVLNTDAWADYQKYKIKNDIFCEFDENGDIYSPMYFEQRTLHLDCFIRIDGKPYLCGYALGRWFVSLIAREGVSDG